MPYYLHPLERCASAEDNPSFETKQAAIAARNDHPEYAGWEISFLISYTERQNWRRRERDRFATSYLNVPWYQDGWCYGNEPFYSHYAHLSLSEPGMVAYTPDDEYGVRDRQIRLTPGRYLAKFAKHLTKPEMDRYIAECKARTSTTGLQLARTADEILAVYRHGPDSCMAHPIDSYPECIIGGKLVHPVTAYADSPDLAVAYLGNLAEKVSARAVCWPDRKLYGRVYGDETLHHIFTHHGYEDGYLQCQTGLSGARIKARRLDCGRYLMPYIDGFDMASLKNGYFVLDNRGPWHVQNTAGVAYEHQTETCSNCDAEYDPEDDGAGHGYCASCNENRHDCQYCDNSHWRDDLTLLYALRGNRVYLCENCESELGVSCVIEDCETRFYPHYQMTRETRARRADQGLSEVCPDCVTNGWRFCSDHSEYYNPSNDVPCSDCDATEPEADNAIA